MTAVTRYFAEQVLRKRPYLTTAMCEAMLGSALRIVTQGDGRVRYWGAVEIDGQMRYLRAVTLEDGATIHNAFIDRNFRPELE